MYNQYMTEPGYEPKRGFPEQPLSMYPPPNMQPVQQQPMHQQPMQPQPMQAPMHRSSSTTVVIQQQPQQVVTLGPRPWSSGLCACGDDCGVCCLAYCCPGIFDCTLSSNAGECCWVASTCPVALRTKIRMRHNIEGSIAGDWCVLAWCGICAKCQMMRELKTHGM